MIKKIFLGLAVFVAIFVVVVAMQKNEFRVQRNAVLAAAPSALFEHVNDQHKFQEWNPWMKLDPNVKTSYSGPVSGVGSVCSWQGDHNVGAGTSTVIESKTDELVRFKMDWKEPMSGTSTVEFTFKPKDEKTEVTWLMYGPNNFMGKLMSLFIDCDKMCGDQFEKGLANLGEAAQMSVLNEVSDSKSP